jgi:ribose transport system substrate-binding protein
MAATVMQFPVQMAGKSAELADEYIKGRRDFDNRTPVEVVLVTPENVSKFLSEK